MASSLSAEQCLITSNHPGGGSSPAFTLFLGSAIHELGGWRFSELRCWARQLQLMGGEGWQGVFSPESLGVPLLSQSSWAGTVKLLSTTSQSQTSSSWSSLKTSCAPCYSGFLPQLMLEEVLGATRWKILVAFCIWSSWGSGKSHLKTRFSNIFSRFFPLSSENFSVRRETMRAFLTQ